MNYEKLRECELNMFPLLKYFYEPKYLSDNGLVIGFFARKGLFGRNMSYWKYLFYRIKYRYGVFIFGFSSGKFDKQGIGHQIEIVYPPYMYSKIKKGTQ